MIIEEQMDKVVTKLDPYKEEAQHENEVIEAIHNLQQTTLEPKTNIFPMDDNNGSMVEREAITTTTVAKERFIVRPANHDIYSTWMDVTHTSIQLEDNNHSSSSPQEEEHGKGDESIVLDIAGYKTGDAEEEDENWDETTVLKKEAVDELLSPQNEENPTEDEKEPKRSLWGWGSAKRQTTNDSLKDEQPAITEDKEGQLELVPGKPYRIEMSLCGFSDFGKEEEENAKLFDQHIITYDNFTHNPNMLNDKRLVFRYEGKYYSAGRTGPLFTTLLLFKKPLEEANTDKADEERSDSRESYQFGRGWRQWLSRSSVAAPTNDNDTQDVKDEETTTFTTTTTTTSVGWSPDHVHPGEKSSNEPFPTHHKVYAKTLRLTSDQLKSLGLKKGVNTISFSVTSAYQGTATCAAKIFYWDHDIQIVISDIDGTITKSDTLGHVFTMIGKDWTHLGVAKLYTDIANNGYHFLYLTSRAIGQADYTRDYLKKVVQDKYQLPDGPVIMSPDRLFTSLHREVIIRKPEMFKMACLKDIQRLFGGRDPFYAGFGNRITDARSYRSVNVPTSRIFTIDPYGDLKLELLLGFKSSYIHLTDLVDQIFPPINRVMDEEYNDWNYWKAPVIDIDIPELDIPLEPTSPKPKPIKPDPTALPASSVVASTSTSTSRRLLRSFTSRSDNNSQTNLAPVNRKLTSSSSTPTLLSNNNSRKFSFSSNTSNEDLNLAKDNEVTSDQKASVALQDDLSTSPTSSIMNKIGSTLSRTFLSSSSSTSTHNEESGVKEEGEMNEQHIQEDVDSLLDNDIDMDDIPFI